MQKGAAHIGQILAVIVIVFLIVVIAFPTLKDKILNYFNSVPKVAVELTPSPTLTPTPSPSPTPSPVPVPTKTPGPPVSTATAKPATPTPAPVVTTTSPPKSGYQKINVATDMGTFTVDIGAGDVASTRVVVDTASESDCTSNCPALPLGTYVSRRGAYAGINGTYFCPAEPAYTSCGANNSFNFLVMNINKYYFNSAGNVYSTNPGVIFGSGYVRFVGAIQEWGRDTSVDGVLSNYPMLVSGGNVSFSGSSDAKLNNKGGRSFVANKGNIVYIGVVRNATVAEAARALKALGMDNALNLDNGGSVAFWYGGYKAGPGRSIPNAILFIAK